MTITFACVRSGKKYGPEYVERLRNGVARHYRGEHEFICLTDQPEEIEGVARIDIAKHGLTAWWVKMILFSPAIRGPNRAIYLDLDTVVVGDLTPLTNTPGDFGICESFTRAAGHASWPCSYGSCAMTFAPGWGQNVWEAFYAEREALMGEAMGFGDQFAIERLITILALGAGVVALPTILQRVLPAGFFLNKRDLHKYPDAPPAGAALVIFGGNERPHNCTIPWVKREWH